MFYIERCEDEFPTTKSIWKPWGLKDGYDTRWDAGTDLIEFKPRPVGTFRIVEAQR